MDWGEFLRRNAATLQDSRTPYELMFAERVLQRVRGLNPGLVRLQYPFRDPAGRARRIDFAVLVDGPPGLAIEVDGYDKRGTGQGQTRAEFDDFLYRQTALVSQGWTVLRFSNRQVRDDSDGCVRFIELTLRNLSSPQRLTTGEQAELHQLRSDMEDELDRLKRQYEVRVRTAEAASSRSRRIAAWGASAAVVAGIVAGVAVATHHGAPGAAPISAYDCPSDHLIKGNINYQGEKIFHSPGGKFYASVKPERCFQDAAEADSAGYRRSLR